MIKYDGQYHIIIIVLLNLHQKKFEHQPKNMLIEIQEKIQLLLYHGMQMIVYVIRSYHGSYKIYNDVPLNPCGRTGITGRGHLGK